MFQKLAAFFMSRSLVSGFLLSLLSLQIKGCGSGDSVFDTSDEGRVSDIRVEPNAIRIGERTTIEVKFFSATSIDTDGDETAAATEVVVLLPPGMDFVSTSSQLDGSILDGFNDRPASTVEICPDGSRALRYDFGSRELSDTVGSAIRLQGEAFEARGTVSVYAAASSSLGAACDVVPQASEDVTLGR